MVDEAARKYARKRIITPRLLEGMNAVKA